MITTAIDNVWRLLTSTNKKKIIRLLTFKLLWIKEALESPEVTYLKQKNSDLINFSEENKNLRLFLRGY